MYKTHFVRQGDHLSRLAHTMGFDADEVWNDPKNKELNELRKDGNILHPGDILFIPRKQPTRLPIVAGTTNRYVAKVPRLETRIAFTDKEGTFANQDYVIDGPGDHFEGTTDEQGNLSFCARVTARVLTLTFPKLGRCLPLLLGHMDPLQEVSGIQKRLAHLGYYHAEMTGDLDEATTNSLLVFQGKNNIAPTGTITQETLEALRKAYGC